MMTTEDRQAAMARAREAKFAKQRGDGEATADLREQNEEGMRFDQRQPFGSFVQKLAVPPREGYHRHWFNDEPGRVDTAKAAGYTHVKDTTTGQNKSRVVDKTTGMLGYLMETPQEWYDHDMAKQQEQIDEFEEAIRRGVDDKGQPGKDGRYIPKQGITINHGTRR